MIKAITSARQSYMRKYFFQDAQEITMSDKTKEMIEKTLTVYTNIHGACRVCGMYIRIDNRLPDGLFVIGGYIGPGQERSTAE